MPAAIGKAIKKQVAPYLQGISRDRIATDNDTGTSTVSDILDEWKTRALKDVRRHQLRLEINFHS